MKISFIIPVYNVELYIAACLDSILENANSNDIEIICIDDASTDNSLGILNQYIKCNNNIYLHQNKKNIGVSDCRNIGLDLATGDYIWFVDGDDVIAPGSINVVESFINKNNYDILCFSAEMFNSETGLTFDFFSKEYKLYLSTINNQWNVPFLLITNLWLCCIKKSFIVANNIKFPEHARLFEDWIFLWNTLLYKPQIYYLNKSLYKYRITNNNSLTKNYINNTQIEELFEIYNQAKKMFIRNRLFDNYEYFCLLRANDIFYHFLSAKDFSLSSYLGYIEKYSSFFLNMNELMFYNLINKYSLRQQRNFKLIKNKSRILIVKFIVKTIKKMKYYKKMVKHIKKFLSPFKFFINWLTEPFSIIYYIFKFFLELISYMLCKVI